jgi:putative heme iron utilization protein
VTDARALADAEEGALSHMNEDHAEALALYAEKLCGAPKGRWRATGLDPEGMDLASGDMTTRLVFPGRVTSSESLRKVLVDLATRARS